jgi:hypothetical protein
MTWINILGWILLAILITGTILFIVGLEAPHKDKPDNTVNYDTFKWVGVALLITGGVGGLIWFWLWRRNKKIEANVINSVSKQEPLLSPSYSRESSFSSGRQSSFNGSMYGGSRLPSVTDSDLNELMQTGSVRPIPLTSDQQALYDEFVQKLNNGTLNSY